MKENDLVLLLEMKGDRPGESIVYHERLKEHLPEAYTISLKEKDEELMHLADGGYETSFKSDVKDFFKRITTPGYSTCQFDGNDTRTPDEIKKAKLDYIHKRKEEFSQTAGEVLYGGCLGGSTFATGMFAFKGFPKAAAIIGTVGIVTTLIGHCLLSHYNDKKEEEYKTGIAKLDLPEE
jgi:hypothetical protein